MYNFNAEQVMKEHQNGVDIIPQVEAAVDEVCKKGYKNIFYIGIGGTILYANQMAAIAKQAGSKLPLFVENAADFCVVGNPHFCKDSVVIIETISGDTKEVVAAVDIAKEVGATVIGYVEKLGTPLAESSDYLITTVGGGYYFWYTVTLRFMKNAGEFPKYDKFFSEIKNMPKNAVNIYINADEKAEAYAELYKDEPIQYLIGSGNLEDWATCYGMCIMEEMQWMRTRPISASNFFHGTLEVIVRDTSVILIKGEDITRPLMDRVENFVNKISAKVTVFDTKDYALEGISDEFRGLLSPIVMRCAFQRISTHLEHKRRHPLEIRRYYRRLNY
ncbi:MAG: SIS domain-containing protein [Herbinix sp.]|nr:SIS domain-containing protein [Herbinix sp.]